MPDPSEYVIGPTPPGTDGYARFETKVGEGSGAGYERWRSYEWRPHTSRKSKEDVYVAHHRLLAVVACYPEDMDIGEILAHMDGHDVHHDAPEVDADTGVKWDNRPDAIRVVEHGRHSEITNAQMRAWAEDRRGSVDPGSVNAVPSEPVCPGCGVEGELMATTVSLDESYCLDCVKGRANGETIEVA